MRKGRITGFFSRIAKWIYHIIALSFIGRLFTSYERCDRGVHAAYVFGGKQGKAPRKRHYTVRRAIACAMEQNIVSRALRAVWRALSFTALRTFGFFFTMLGALWLVLYVVQTFSTLSGLVTWSHLVAGLAVLAVGVLLLLSDRSLGNVLRKGSLLGLLLFHGLGVSDELAREAPARGVAHYPAALLFAIFVAALGLLTAPLSILAILSVLLVVAMVLSVPEAGFILTVLVLPFSRLLTGSDFLTLAFAGLTIVGYLGKVLRGNRAFRLDWQDFPLALLAVLLFSAGFTATGTGAWREVFTNLLLLFFYVVAVNILATPHWLTRSRLALGISATAAAFLGITRLFNAILHTEGASLSQMMRYGSVMHVGFADHRAFALYLVVAFSFLVPAVFRTTGLRRFGAVVGTLAVGTAIAFTGMTGAWLAALAVPIVFLLVFDHRSLFAVLFGGGALTGAAFLLPTAARSAIFDIFKDVNAPARATGRSIVHTLFSHEGEGFFGGESAVLRLFFGMGEGSLATIYPYVGNLAAPFGYEVYYFWQAMLIEYGLLGVILPALFLFVLLQNSFTALARAPHGKHLAYVGITLVAAVLVFSFFGYVFYDKAVLAAFLAAAALIAADLRYCHGRYIYRDETVTDITAAELSYRKAVKRAPVTGEGGAV
ncbi:MAG: hypothetical protein IJC99_04790 [Clostridia bacterium]|nr:hypothetical protein [Clostridia bacterium]